MIISLENGISSAKIDTLGAQLMSFADSMGLEYIWQGDKEYWGSRAPILFPIVGALRNKTTYVDGKAYKMERHGIARRMEFDVSEKRSDRAVFTLRANDESRSHYPFDFELIVEFELRSNSLIQSFKVKNCGNSDMPYCLGGHPAINVPLLSDEKFEDYVIKFSKPESCECPSIDMENGLVITQKPHMSFNNDDTIKLEHSLFYNDAIVIQNVKSSSVELYSVISGQGVKFDFSGFKHFAMWSAVNDAPFVCLEPWTSTATRDIENDNLVDKQDIIMLKPGETREHSFSITQL
mgnify:FL=1